MCKSSSLVFVLAFAFLFRLETFSIRLVGVILLIFTGVLLMVATETHFVLGGFILVLSASALGGLRWSLTQLLMRDKRSGMNHPVATIFWLAPIMGLTIAIVSVSIESWSELWGSRFFDGTSATLRTIGLLVLPGIIAFTMVLSEYQYVPLLLSFSVRPPLNRRLPRLQHNPARWCCAHVNYGNCKRGCDHQCVSLAIRR